MFGSKEVLRRIADLEKKYSQAMDELTRVRTALDSHIRRDTIFDKAFRAGGLWGDYLEFGTFRGDSFASAYASAFSIYSEMVSGHWDHSFEDADSGRDRFHRAWSDLRFIGFDSFEGIPRPEGIDSEMEVFKQGTYACSEENFLRNIEGHGVDLKKVVTVKGFFQTTLTSKTAAELSLNKAAVVHIDSDLYESARLALDFVTPFLIDGAIVIFDEWYQFMASPYRGERRAFREWCVAHPEWVVSGFQKEGAFRNSFVLSKRSDSNTEERPSALFS